MLSRKRKGERKEAIQRMYLGLGWWGDVEGFHCEGSVELENALRRNKQLKIYCLFSINSFGLCTCFLLLLYFFCFFHANRKLWMYVVIRKIMLSPFLCLPERLLRTSYASSSKGMTMLSNRPSSVVGISILQGKLVSYINIVTQHVYRKTVLYCSYTYIYVSHLISLRSSSFSGLSKMAKRGRTKSSITLSDRNWEKD